MSAGIAARPAAMARLWQGARRKYLAGTLSVLGGLLLWEILSRFIVANPLFLAAPSQILQAIYALTETGEMQRHIAISAVEFALGYVIASVIGIVIWSKVLVVIFLVLFPVTINTEAGLRTTSERLIEMLRSFGASPRQIFFKVSLPSAVPFILAGLKIAIGRGLIGVVVAELFGSRAGLGRLIAQSADAFNMPELFAGVVVLAIAGILMTAGFTWLEGRLVPWTRD